jgi:hypothetical protein
MQPIAFDPSSDLAPIPFDDEVCELARRLKESGLPWKPHVGCIVWDHQQWINVASPFPNHVYFILSLPRFLDIFGSLPALQEKLVWLPTWHQARLLCQEYGIAPSAQPQWSLPQKELAALYGRLITALENR